MDKETALNNLVEFAKCGLNHNGRDKSLAEQWAKTIKEGNLVENRVIASEQPKGDLVNGAVAGILPKLEGVSIDEQLATVSNIKECLAVIVNDLETQYYEGNPLPGRKEFLENLINKIYEIATASL